MMSKVKNWIRQIISIKMCLLLAVSLGFVLLMSFDINSWYYSAIGDEYAFFNLAKQIALGEVRLSILPSHGSLSILDQRGVYSVVPVWTSFYQSVIMRILGIDHQGWITSSILLVVASFWLLYFGIKNIFSSKVAAFSTFIFAASHYLWAFSHTGYWNIQAIFPPILSFYLTTLAFKKGDRFLWLLVGLASGSSLYVHYYSGISIPLILLCLYFYRRKLRKIEVAAHLAGILITLIPYFYINYQTTIDVIFSRTLTGSSEIPQDQRTYYFAKNFVDSFLAFYRNRGASHYVSGPLIDTVTGLLFGLGLIIMVREWKKYFIIFATLIALLTMLGGFSQYTYPPITRLYFLLPFTSLTAGFGLEKLLSPLEKRAKKPTYVFASLLILAVILALNTNQFFRLTPKRYQTTSEAVAIRAFKEACLDRKTAIVDETPEPLLKPALESYRFSNLPSLLRTDETDISLLSPYSCVIFTRVAKESTISLLTKFEEVFPTAVKTATADLTGREQVYIYRR